MQDMQHDTHRSEGPHHLRHINWGLLFVFSAFLPPGANYMYMGLIMRGLATMCGFFMLIFIITVAPFQPIVIAAGLCIPIYYLTTIFDGFNLRRRINRGEIVADGAGGIFAMLFKHKILGLIVLAIVVVTIVSAIVGVVINIVAGLLPFVVVGLGIYVIYRAVKSRRRG